jgi:hypothetical protein
VAFYGRSAVERGNMAMRVREKKTTLPADVVPCFEYHRVYGTDGSGQPLYHQGTRIYPDRGSHVHNWEQQHYERGVEKNNATGGRFKKIVRAFKRLENDLVSANIIAELPSFFMECLVYNVPDPSFRHESYVDNMKGVLAAIFHATKTDEDCKDWVEVNRMKYLFHASQPWTREQANALALAGWARMGLG